MGRHSAPRSPAPLIPEEPVKSGPRHARPVAARQFAVRGILGGPPAGPGHHSSALHRSGHHSSALSRPAHHRAATPAQPNRPPLWRRSPAVPAAVAVLAVWSSANLPQMLSSGHAGSGARAASSEVERNTLAAAGTGLGGGGLAGGEGSDADGGSTAEDVNTMVAAARLAADRRVSRGDRTPLGAALKAPARKATAVKPARKATAVKPATKPAAPAKAAQAAQAAVGRWVRPSAGGQSSCFCMRWGRMHDGIDLAGPNGSPIVAVGDGVVVESGPAAGYGMWVVIRHSNGDYSVYAHMYRTYVSVGEHVRAGRHIADIGSNGYSTGPHLHFEIAKGSPTGPRVDPAPWLRARGVEVGPYNPNA
ncbi:MAG TPA: M23 family metallopeptidase [Jatrophihabitans sp.]|uniref:M23 family metallopeptidase n=1 Tax=Jatrophihabitans sp. TaxID=1932789 RepID=UPI002EFF4A53